MRQHCEMMCYSKFSADVHCLLQKCTGSKEAHQFQVHSVKTFRVEPCN